MSPELDPAHLGDHLDRLYRAAWALTGHREDAEDLVQETYLRALSKPRWLHRDESLGYLLGVLRNTFLTRLRDQRRRISPVPLPDDPGTVEDRGAVQPHAALEAREVYAAIAALSDEYRDALVAVDVAGLSYKEAAKALGAREGTIMSRLYRARRRVVAAVAG